MSFQPTTMRHLNCMTYDPETGTYTYDPERNPLLVKGLTSTTFFGFNITNRRDNSDHATQSAATAMVNALNRIIGGFSLAPPEAGYGLTQLWGWGYVRWSAPKLLIERPDGETFAAGLIGYILGNEAYCPAEPQRDARIYELFGYSQPEIDAAIRLSRNGAAPWLSEVIISLALEE